MNDQYGKWMDDASAMYLQQKEIERLQCIVDRAVMLAEYYAPMLHGRRAQEWLDSLWEEDEE